VFPLRVSADVHKEVLPNGLTVLVQRHNSAPVVAVVTHVKAGYFDEPDEWVGMSHVLEHMFFKGTSRRGPGDIARDTQSLGGYLNAGTSYDKTVYYTVLPSGGNGLEKALDIQSDALRNSTLDTEELTRELEVIIQEAKRKLDSPDAVTGETLFELLFTTHRMRRWRIGTEAGLRTFTAQAIREYYTTRYTPGRVVVGIVGDIGVERAIDLAHSIYGDWDRPTATIGSSPSEPDGVTPTARLIFGDVKRPIGVVGWRTVGTLHPDTPALDVTASVLGSGRGARLYRTIRTPGLASSVGAGHFTPTEVGVFNISLAADTEKLDDAVSRSVEVVSELIGKGPDARELDRTRALMKMRWARAFESMDSRATALCEAEALGGYELVDEMYRRTEEVTAEDVRRVASHYLNPDCASAVMYLPEGGSSRFGGGAWPLQPAGVSQIEHPTMPSLVGVTRAAADIVETAHYEGDVTRRSYEGVDMLVRSKRGCGLVSLGLDVVDLPSLETAVNAGISRLLVRSTVRGAGGMTGEELALAAESLGGGIMASSAADGLGWGITVPPESLREAAELLRKVALEPTLAAQDVAKERALQVSDARRSQDDMFRYPIQRVLAKAFAGHSYGLPQLGEPETVEALTEADVCEWGCAIGSHRAVVVAVGDLEREEMLEALMPLATWPAVDVPGNNVKLIPEFHEGSGSEERDKAQSALAMAFPAVPAASPDRFAVAIVGSILTGLAGRLFEELRDKRSLAYTVLAVPWLRRRAGAMLGYIATSPARESEAREEMLKELERLVKYPVPEAELERARNYAAGLVEIRQQNASSVASEILSAWLNGALDELTTTAECLRAVTAEDVARVANDVFGSGQRAEYVVRGTGKGR
jgi:zinc protease